MTNESAFPVGEDYSNIWVDGFSVGDAEKYDNKYRDPVRAYRNNVQAMICKEWVRTGLCLDAPSGSGRMTKAIRVLRPDVGLSDHLSIRRREDLKGALGQLIGRVEKVRGAHVATGDGVNAHVIVDGRSTERMADLIQHLGGA